MNLQVNITAGEILLLLDEKKRPMSLEEIQYYLEKPVSTVNLAVGRLIRGALIGIKVKGRKRCIVRKYDVKNEGVLNSFGEACCSV